MTTTTKDPFTRTHPDTINTRFVGQTVATKRLHTLMAVSLVLMTGLFWLTPLDKVVSAQFLGPTGWIGPSSQILAWFYYPLNAVFFLVPLLVGSLILLVSIAPTDGLRRARPYRRIGLFMMSTTLLGAGLSNSFLLKLVFARPRPYAVFSGDADFLRPLEIGVAYWGSMDMSFPSGHVSMATVSLVFFFGFRTAKRPLSKVVKWGLGVSLPLVAAPIMTVSRVAYGEHFLSDGIFAMALTYGVTLFLYHQFDLPEVHRRLQSERLPRGRTQLGLHDFLFILVSLVLVLALIMMLIIRFDGLRRLV